MNLAAYANSFTTPEECITETSKIPVILNSYKNCKDEKEVTDSITLYPLDFMRKHNYDCKITCKDEFVTRKMDVFYSPKKNERKKVFSEKNKIHLDKVDNCIRIKTNYMLSDILEKDEHDYSCMKYLFGKKNLSVDKEMYNLVVLGGLLIFLLILLRKVFKNVVNLTEPFS